MVMLLLGLGFFIVALWIIDSVGVHLYGTNGLDPNWTVLSAALLATGSILAGAFLQEER